MEEYLESTEGDAYSTVYMKSKIQEHFGYKIVITTVKNIANVVTFQQKAASLINEFYCQSKTEDYEKEKARHTETATK